MREFRLRLKKLDNLENSYGLDAILLFQPQNIFYFTNSDITSNDGIFFYDFSKPNFFISRMVKPKAWIKPKVIKKLDDVLNIQGNIGIDDVPLSLHKRIKRKGIRLVEISDHLSNMRMIKSKYEIRQIKRACEISKKVFEKILVEKNKKTSEFELKGLIEFYMNKYGVEPSFPTIVACGNHIAIPHHKPTNKKLKEPILIDFGIRYNGYCSDISRTFGSRHEKKINAIINDIESNLKTGVKTSDLEMLFRKSLGKFKKYAICSLGHGIGISVHEKPSISKQSKDILKSSMVITLEPALYMKNGIRIENDYLITDSGFENLTNF